MSDTPKHLVFVCTGNICRSPLAERLALAWAEQEGAPLTAESAGTRAVVGHGMESHAARVLEDLGGTPEGFVARRLTPQIASAGDLVLTMSRSHRDRILEIAPRQLQRTFTLVEAARLLEVTGEPDPAQWSRVRDTVAREDLDVPDPIGQPMSVFVDMGTQVAETLIPVLTAWR